jgi:hypothetical protein
LEQAPVETTFQNAISDLARKYSGESFPEFVRLLRLTSLQM